MQRSRRQGFGVWLLLYQIFGVIGIDRIPPATLAITAAQVLIFLRVIPVPWYSASDVCISVDTVWHRKQWLRLLYGSIEHGSDLHLYYNMISFVWKGISLEPRLGSARFAYLVSVFTALCSITLVGLSSLAGNFADRQFYHQCAVGFSGVLFALKVLTTHYWPHGSQNIMGLPFQLPVRYMVWVELLLIQLLVPNASLLGHLAGVIVGLAYLHSPLGFIINQLWNIISSLAFATPNPSNRFNSSGSTGYASNRARQFTPGGMTEEEQFEFARQESLRSNYNQRSDRNFYSSSAQYRPGQSTEFPDHRDFIPNPPYNQNYRPTQATPPYPETDFIQPTVPTSRPSLYPDLDDMRRKRTEFFES